MMKVCVLFLLAALPALCQFGDARSLQHQPIKPGMTCASTAYVLTWVSANNQFECLPASGAPSGAAGGVLGGTYPSPTFAGGASFNANAATFLNGAGSFTSPGTANARITFSNVASATMTLTGVAVKAVVTCWDSSVSPARLFIPDSVEQTDADTLTFNFSPNATGYCDGSTGVGLTGATGATGPAGSSAFSALTSSTNSTAAMVVGTGASLAASGSGAITATKLGSGSYIPILASGAPGAAVAADIVSLFSTCSGTQYLGADGACHTPGATGANAALSNLASVSINAALGFQTGIAVGNTTNPAKNIVFNASGTYGTGSYTYAGTPTANRTITLADADMTMLYSGGPGGTPASLTLTNALSLPAAALPAFTGDMTTSAGAAATTVKGANGVLYSGLATGILKNTTTTGVPSIALAADTVAQFSGSCPSGATCALASDGTKQTVAAFPYAYQRGSFIGIGLSLSSSANITTLPFNNAFSVTAACTSTNGAAFWHMPLGGFIRNLAGTTGIANATSDIRWGIDPGCQATTAYLGGPVTVTGAAAGGVVGSNVADWWHVNQWNPLAMGFIRQGATNTAAPISELAEFISDDGLQATLIGVAYNASPSASSTQYFGVANTITSTEANVTLPIPVAGTFKNLFVTSNVQPANPVTVNFMKNLATTTLTTTIGTTDAGGTNVDTTHTVAVVAGDSVDFQTVTGASTQATIQALGVAFTPTTAGDTFIWGTFNAGTVTTTNKYALPLSSLTGTAIASFEATMPFACTVSNLYVYQAGANGGGVTTTFTMMKNGSTTAITGTITSASGSGGTGSILVDGTHSVSYAQGDLITIQYITGSGTSGAMATWAAKCN